MKILINIGKVITILLLLVICIYTLGEGLTYILFSDLFLVAISVWIALLSFLSSLLFTCVFIISLLFRTGKPKLFGIILLCSLFIFGVINFGTLAYNNYEEQQKVKEEINLNLYKPFYEPTKLAELSKKPTIKFTNNLPRLDGATALYPIYSAFARALYPRTDYTITVFNLPGSAVSCTTTGLAYTNLVDGNSDIVFAAEPSKEQLAYAKSKGKDLYLTPIGKEAFVFLVNENNKVSNLSTSSIKDIYGGAVTDWSQLGGEKRKITAYQRPEGSGSQTVFLSIMKGVKLISPVEEQVAGDMGTMIDKVADYQNSKNAIGYSFRYYASTMNANHKIKFLSINGIAPTKETIKSGKYPYSADFYAVTIGNPKGNVKKLIDWVLSPQGQEIIEKTGYVTIK